MLPFVPQPQVRRKKKEPPAHDPRRTLYILGIVALCGVALIGQTYWVSKNRVRFAPFAIERIRCDECKGMGLLSQRDAEGVNRLVLCEACFGLGSRQIRRVDDFDLLCPACVGFGRVEEGEGAWRWCRRCEGRGLVRPPGAPPPTYQPPMPRYLSTNVYESLGIKTEDILQKKSPEEAPAP